MKNMKKSVLLNLRAMASQEYTVEQIAKKLGITKGEAEYFVWKMGYKAKYDEPRPIENMMRYQPEHGVFVEPIFEDDTEHKKQTYHLTPEDYKKISKLKNQGFCTTDIALKVGKSRDAIRKAIEKLEDKKHER